MFYDGAGQRVEQQEVSGGATTTMLSVGSEEELSTTSGVTTTTTYYYAGGKRVALAVNGSFSYLGVDELGSASVALDGSGNVQASVLYGPYGAVRYSSGTLPGSYGYTGQQADATTGLDYYNARYYDASAGQFASADTAQDGLNRYGYVHGNPTTFTDPTGHHCNSPDDMGCGGTGGGCTTKCGGGGGGGGGCTQNCGGCTQNCWTPVSYQCAHNCAPGCKGTVDQCKQWSALQSADEAKLQLWIGILQFAIGAILLFVDLQAIFSGGGLKGFEKLKKIVDAFADGLTLISGGLNIAQALGWGNFAGFRKWVSTAGAVVNSIAAVLDGMGDQAGWYVDLTIGLLLNGATNLNFLGILGLIVQLTLSNLKMGGDDLRAFVYRIGQGLLDTADAVLASTQAQNVNQWCSSSAVRCPGYK